jgi:hypothetical protein
MEDPRGPPPPYAAPAPAQQPYNPYLPALAPTYQPLPYYYVPTAPSVPRGYTTAAYTGYTPAIPEYNRPTAIYQPQVHGYTVAAPVQPTAPPAPPAPTFVTIRTTQPTPSPKNNECCSIM